MWHINLFKTIVMPVRRGLIAPRTTLIETIIRKFDTDSKYLAYIEVTFTYFEITILINIIR